MEGASEGGIGGERVSRREVWMGGGGCEGEGGSGGVFTWWFLCVALLLLFLPAVE